MTPDRWRQVDDLCHAALARPAEDRAAFLATACAGDDVLRGEVESLLAEESNAVDKALTELKTTGRMTEAQKGALSKEISDEVEQVEELNTRSRKYNLPRASAPERQ